MNTTSVTQGRERQRFRLQARWWLGGSRALSSTSVQGCSRDPAGGRFKSCPPAGAPPTLPARIGNSLKEDNRSRPRGHRPHTSAQTVRVQTLQVPTAPAQGPSPPALTPQVTSTACGFGVPTRLAHMRVHLQPGPPQPPRSPTRALQTPGPRSSAPTPHPPADPPTC